jgi:hypothetical protein
LEKQTQRLPLRPLQKTAPRKQGAFSTNATKFKDFLEKTFGKPIWQTIFAAHLKNRRRFEITNP